MVGSMNLNSAITSRILRAYRAASPQDLEDGKTWYPRAHQWCEELAEEYGTTLETVAGLTAVLSPGCPWDRNQSATVAALVAHRYEDELPRHISVYGMLALDKAQRILNGDDPEDVLSGPKVSAFYSCLVAPATARAVVVDRHARCLALGLQRSDANGIVKGEREYLYLAQHYENAAVKLGVLPSTVQAVTWVHWRNTATPERYLRATSLHSARPRVYPSRDYRGRGV